MSVPDDTLIYIYEVRNSLFQSPERVRMIFDIISRGEQR